MAVFLVFTGLVVETVTAIFLCTVQFTIYRKFAGRNVPKLPETLTSDFSSNLS